MSAVDFLFTPGMQRVLAVVYSDPNHAFTLSELLKAARNGNGSTHRQIDRLVEAGVLIEEPRRGRQRSLKANTAFFIYPELRSIAQKSFGLAEPLLDALAPFEDRISEAFVFGSVATQSDSHRSDIDLIVVGTAGLLELSERLVTVEQTLGRPVHLNLYTADEWADLQKSDPVLAQISAGSKLQLLPHAKTH